MALKALRLSPKILVNKLFLKRNVNIIVTHAPPYKIHDQEDVCHRGFKIFVKLIEKYRPTLFLHGHIHTYNTGRKDITVIGGTSVMNCYGYRVIAIK
jgi:Icc-related predicted phosphoesterase